MNIIDNYKNNYHFKDNYWEIFVRIVNGKYLFYSVWRVEDFKNFCDRPLEMLSPLVTKDVPEMLIHIRKVKLEKLLNSN